MKESTLDNRQFDPPLVSEEPVDNRKFLIGVLALVLASGGIVFLGVIGSLDFALSLVPAFDSTELNSALFRFASYFFKWGPFVALPLGFISRKTRPGLCAIIFSVLMAPVCLFLIGFSHVLRF